MTSSPHRNRLRAVTVHDAVAVALDSMRIEARSIERAAEHLADDLVAAVELIRATRGRVLVSGLGKSGHIGGKIAATLASTGTPAQFIHAGEALHGDSGAAKAHDDVGLLISNSGETAEVCRFGSMLTSWDVPVIAMTSKPGSTLARLAKVHLDISVEREADPLRLAPTASTTVTLSIGDALAAALMTLSGFTSEQFADRHPGGPLGLLLTPDQEGG